MADEIERRFFVSSVLASLGEPNQTILDIWQGYIPKDRMKLEATQHGFFIVFDSGMQKATMIVPEADYNEILKIAEPTIRIRKTTDPYSNAEDPETKYYLTIKGKRVGNTCPEFEYEIFNPECVQLLLGIVVDSITKTRRSIPYGSIVIELDEFLYENAGLVIAEVELDYEGQEFAKPAWLGIEIPDDMAASLSNRALARKPIIKWDHLAFKMLEIRGGLRRRPPTGQSKIHFSID